MINVLPEPLNPVVLPLVSFTRNCLGTSIWFSSKKVNAIFTFSFLISVLLFNFILNFDASSLNAFVGGTATSLTSPNLNVGLVSVSVSTAISLAITTPVLPSSFFWIVSAISLSLLIWENVSSTSLS